MSDKSRDSYVQRLERRLRFAYKPAEKEAEKAGKGHKARYDLRVRSSVLKPGDRVLLKNVGLRGKHKLANKSNCIPYVVKSHPDVNIPVYVVKREYGQGGVNTVHRNLLLPIVSLPHSEKFHPLIRVSPH